MSWNTAFSLHLFAFCIQNKATCFRGLTWNKGHILAGILYILYQLQIPHIFQYDLVKSQIGNIESKITNNNFKYYVEEKNVFFLRANKLFT